MNKLVISNDVAQREDEAGLTLVDALTECYKNAKLSIERYRVGFLCVKLWRSYKIGRSKFIP